MPKHPTRTSRSLLLFTVCASVVASVAACSQPQEGSSAEAGAAQATQGGQAAESGAIVATIVELHGQGGLASPELGEGVFLGKGASLHAGQRIATPAGLRAELALNDGTRIRIDEASEMVLPSAEAGAPIHLQTGRVIVVAGQSPAAIESHGERLEIHSGRAQLEATPDARTWSVLAGRAQLKLADREVELQAGASLNTPLAPSAPAPQPVLSLAPLHSSAWAVDFEQAKHLAAAVPPGVGSLTARRPNTQSESQPLRLAEQKVRVTIRGRVAHTEIEQAFVNDSGVELEGTYRFPLPSDASISGLSLLVGSRWMEGAMVEKTRARQIFKSIVDRVVPRDPALFEWEQGNVFKLKIFPLPAHGERRVRLSYTQQLDESEAGQLRYRYPMGGSGAGATEIGEFDFKVAIDASNLEGVSTDQVRTPMIPAHRIARQSSEGNLHLHRHEQSFTPTHELGVDVPAPREGMITHTDRDGQTYFMLSMRPEFAVPPTEAVDYVFVADRSHATAPEIWTAAQGLVQASIESLDPNDRFTVLACDTACDVLSTQLMAPGAEASRQVATFMSGQRIGGASDIGAMLEQASALLPARSGGTRVVVYLGDGVASSGELSTDALVSLAQSEVMHGVRLEAVALGSRADEMVLGALSEVTGGDLIHAGVSDDLGAVARELQYRARIPALHDLDLQLPAGAYAVHPRTVPPLRSGEELVVTGKLRSGMGTAMGSGSQSSAVLRRRSTGETTTVPVVNAAHGDKSHPYLPRLWAASEINWLTAHRGHAAKREIVALSKDYTVMSRYTSLLALENDAMYRQYGVRRRAHEKDRWRGELALGAFPLLRAGGAPLGGLLPTGTTSKTNDDERTKNRSAITPTATADANAPTSESDKSGAWDFVGDRKETSRNSELANKGEGSARAQGAPEADELNEPEEEEVADITLGAEQRETGANAAPRDELQKQGTASGPGKAEAPQTAMPAAAPKADDAKDAGEFWPDVPKESEADSFDEDAEGESTLDNAGYGRGDAPGASAAAKASRKPRPKAPPKKSKTKRPPVGNGSSSGADPWGGADIAYDDTPMIAKRPPLPKLRIREAHGPSAGDLRRLEDLLRRRDAAPTDRARHRALVSAAMRAGDARAPQWAADWAEIDPDHFRALIAHADALAMRAHPMAMRAYESAAEANPYSDSLHRWLATALETQGDFARACSHRRAVVSIDPAKARAHIALARCVGLAGNAPAMPAILDAAMGRAKDSGKLRTARARALDGRLLAPTPLPSHPNLRAEITFDPAVDVDVAFVDHRGRRLSASHPEGGVVAQRARGKVVLTMRRYSRPVYVEVTRKGTGAPVSAHLKLRTSNGHRNFDLQLSEGTQRVAYMYKR